MSVTLRRLTGYTPASGASGTLGGFGGLAGDYVIMHFWWYGGSSAQAAPTFDVPWLTVRAHQSSGRARVSTSTWMHTTIAAGFVPGEVSSVSYTLPISATVIAEPAFYTEVVSEAEQVAFGGVNVAPTSPYPAFDLLGDAFLSFMYMEQAGAMFSDPSPAEPLTGSVTRNNTAGGLTARVSHVVASYAGGTVGPFSPGEAISGADYIGAVARVYKEFTQSLVASPTDRYRVNLGADSRSLLASASAVPFDASASVSLPPAVGLLPQQTLYPIRELTRDSTGVVYDAVFYPRATQNDRQERTYDGVTVLSRMQTAYPAAIFDTVTNLGLANNIASTIITYVLTQWASEFPWFGFETVPDLRFPVPGSTGVKAPSEYQPAGDFKLTEGIIRSDIVALPQEDGNRRSMYDWLTDLLSPFPGAVFFQNAAGNLQIVPAYGPDADETPYKTLGSDDVVSVSLGEPSIGTIINRVTVSSRGYQRSDAVEVMQPAWFQVGAQELYGEAVWYEPPVDRVNLQAPSDTTATIRQEDEFTSADSFLAQTPTVWPVSTTNIPAGTGISLVDSVDASLVTVGWSRYQRFGTGTPSLITSGTTGLTLLQTEVPFDRTWRPTLRWDGSAGLFNFSLVINASWQPEQGGIALAIGSAVLSRFTGSNLFDQFVVEFTLNDESAGYAEQSGVTATFGTTATSAENPIPNSDGSEDAVTESQATYGVLEERVDVRGYVLSAEQALAMAQGIVLANLSPRAIRSLDLGWRGSTVPLFDDRGRLFGTPDSGEGLLVGVEYTDDFISVTGGKRVRIEETVPSLPGFIPTDTAWLLNDDSSFWTNEDGTNSEPA